MSAEGSAPFELPEPPAVPARPRWWRRWFVRWPLRLVAAVVLLVVGILGLLQVPPVRAWVVEEALAAVNGLIAGEVGVEALERNLLTTVRLRGVTLRHPDGSEVIRVDSLSADLDLPALLARTAPVTGVVISGLSGTIFDDTGEVALLKAVALVDPTPDPDPPGEPGPPWRVTLSALTLDGVIVHEQAGGGRTLRLALEAAFELGPGVERVYLRRLALREGAANGVTLAGVLDSFSAPHLDLSLTDLTVDLGSVGVEGVGGDLAGGGAVSGSLDDAGLRLDLTSAGGTVALGGRAGLGDDGPHWELTLDATGLRPTAFVPALEPDLGFDFHLTTHGAGDPTSEGTARATLLLLGLDGLDGPPLPLRLDAWLDRGAAHADLAGSDSRGGYVEVHAGTPSLNAASLDLSAVILGADIARWVPFLEQVGIGRGLGAKLDEVRAIAHVDRLEGGSVAADASWRVRARDITVPAPLGGPASVAVLETSGEVAYIGFGLPTGTVALAASGVSAAGAALDDIELAADLTGAGGDRLRVAGTIEAEGVGYQDTTRLERLSLPFDLIIDEALQPREGTASLHASGLAHETHRVGAAGAELTLGDGADGNTLKGPVSVRDVEIGGTMALAHATVNVDAHRTFAGAVDANLGIEVGSLVSKAGLAVAGAAGALRVALAADRPMEPTVTGQVAVKQLRTPEARVDRIALTIDAGLPGGVPAGVVRVEGHRIRVGHSRIGQATVTAKIDADGHNTLAATSRGGDLEVAIDLSVEGVLDGTQTLSTRIRDGRVAKKGVGVRLEPGGRATFDPMTGVVEVKDAAVSLIGPRKSRIDASGRFDPRTNRVRAKVATDGLPLATWVDTARRLGLSLASLGPVAGRLSASADIDGTLRRPEAKVSARLTGGMLGDLQDIGLTLEATITEAATALGFDAAWRGGHKVKVSLALPERVGISWRPRAATALALELEARSLDLYELRAWLPKVSGKAIRGKVDGAMDFAGTIRSPSGTSKWTLAGLETGSPSDADGSVDLTVDAEGLRGTLALSTRGRDRLALTAEMPRSVLEAATLRSGRALAAEPLKLKLDLAPTRVGDLPFTSGLGALKRVTAQAALRVAGTVAAPTVEGSVRVSSIPIQTTTAIAALDLETRGGLLKGVVSVTSRGRELLDGVLTVPIESAMAGPDKLMSDSRLRIGLSSHLPVSAVSELDPGIGRFLADAVDKSNINLTASVIGGRPGERRISAQASLQSSRPEQELAMLGLASSMRASVEMQEEATVLHFVTEQGPHGGHLHLHAELEDGIAGLLRGELGPATALAGGMTSEGFDLAGLAKALPRVFGPTHGQLKAAATLGGTLGDPQFSGTMGLAFKEVHLIPLGYIQRDLNLTVAFDRETLRLEPPLHIGKRGGTLDMTLSVDTRSLDPARMALTGQLAMKSFQMLNRRDAQLTLSGGVKLGGTVAAPIVEGRIVVDEGNLAPDFGGREVQPIGLPKDVVFVSAEETADEAVRGDDSEQPTIGTSAAGAALDVVIAIPPRTIRVKNDMADILLEGDIQVRTRDGLISVAGVISVLYGKVQIVGLEWDIDRSSKVILTGSPIIDPLLNIQAETDISDVDLSAIGMRADRDSRIYVSVTGTATEPKLELSSNIGLDQTHILSILAIGKPIGDIGAAGDSGGSSQQETPLESQMISTVVGVAMGSISTLVTKNLPVDVFELQAGGELGFEEAQLRVGKRITRDWLLFYSLDLGATKDASSGELVENMNELTSEYAITPWLLWEVKVGDAGQGATELMFRWRF